MKRRSGSLNRGWLAVIGIVLVLAGVTGALIAFGGAGRLVAPTGLDIPVASPSSPVFDAGLGNFFARTSAAVGIAVLGVVVGVLGLAWLLAQIPRTNGAGPFRLSDDSVRGLTTCTPAVLTDAVVADATSLPGVTAASAVLRGTAERPELTLRVTVNERTDIRELLQVLENETAARLASAMEAPLQRLAVQVDVTTARRTADRVVL